jgi:hypothetical protein
MGKLFNTITAFALLLLTSLPVTFAVCFLASQAYITNKMKQELKYRQLETIILSKEDIHWVEEDRELLINHHMFDVESLVVRRDGKIEVKGLYDEAEDKLNAQLERMMQNQKSQQSTSVFAFLYYQFIYESSQAPIFNISSPPAVDITYAAFYNDSFTPVYLTRHLPPPKG